MERRWGKDLYRKFQIYQIYLWGAGDGMRVDRNQAYRLVLEKPS